MGLKQAIKSLDAFPRAEDHLLQKTQSGAFVSVVGLLIMATLFVHELSYYLSTYTVHQNRYFTAFWTARKKPAAAAKHSTE